MPTLTKTTIIGAGEPFDIRRCPIWAIPQLAFYKKACKAVGMDIEFFEFRHSDGIGLVTVWVCMQGLFEYKIYRRDMNDPQIPDLGISFYPNPKPSLKIGDRVRHMDPAYRLEGVVQEIEPCSKSDCDHMTLTLDPAGQDENGMARTRFFYHMSSFELVSPN